MSIILPDQATANIDSNATIASDTAAAQTVFIAAVTVLINQAINNGLFQVEPFMVPLVSSTYISTYFQGLGYTVVFPIFPFCCTQWNPCFVAGWPEVLPPNYVPWNCGCGYNGPPRIQISWGP